MEDPRGTVTERGPGDDGAGTDASPGGGHDDVRIVRPASPVRRLLGRLVAVRLTLVAIAVGGLVRLAVVSAGSPYWWQDSDDYAAVGAQPLWSVDLWAGSRPPLIPLVLRFTGGEPGGGFVLAQVGIAAVCWGLLAGALAHSMPTPGTRRSAAAVVVCFSLVTPITMWDQSILTETLTLALLALTTAFGLRAVQTGSPRWLAAAVVASVVWVLARDTVAVVLVVAAVVMAVAWWVGGRRGPWVPAAAAVLVVVAGISSVASSHGERDHVPLANVMFVRVLPYPDRVDWFVDRGMPGGDHFRALAAGVVPDGRVAPVVGVPRDDPTFDGWWAWLHDDGKATLARWAVSHPGYLITEPLERPERSYNNADGDIAFYLPAGMTHLPVLTSVLWINVPTALVALAVIGLWWRRTRQPGSPLWSAAGLLAVTSSAYVFVAWHSDGMETARHIFVGGVAFRLALVVAVFAVVAALHDRHAARPPAALGPVEPTDP